MCQYDLSIRISFTDYDSDQKSLGETSALDCSLAKCYGSAITVVFGYVMD